jgi:hypothetical protein
MRSVSRPALVLPLLALLSLPAAAQETAARLLHQRTAYWSPGVAAVELHVAAGTSTLVRLESFPERLSLVLTEGRSNVQLLPAGDSSFIVAPSSDFALGERALVTVRLGPPDMVLTLLLVSREDRVDGEMRLVRLNAPTSTELDVDALARLLNATPQGRVSLAVKGPLLQGSKVRVQVESVLQMDARVFVTLAVCPKGRRKTLWEPERARLQVLLGDGSELEVPLLLVSSHLERVQQRHTLVAPLPERPLRLFLALEGEGAPEGFFPLSSGEERPLP